MSAVDDVADLLVRAGFVRDGATATRTVRMPESKSPIGNRGKSGGKVRSYGGRQRWRKGSVVVTVGKLTTFVYREGEPGENLGHFNTSDLAGIRTVIS